MPNLTPYAATDDTWVLPSYLPIPNVPGPGFGLLVVHSFLIKSQQPVLVDTGMPIVKDEFVESLWSLIDPQDLRWIFMTHDDGDHTGAIEEVMAAAPQAKVITQFLGLNRLETVHHVDPSRFIIVNSGQSFNVGDREIAVLRPPVFDSPSTSAYFDLKTEMLFSADALGPSSPNWPRRWATCPLRPMLRASRFSTA